MPYIPEPDRRRAGKHPQSAGELNYAITRLIFAYTVSRQPLYAPEPAWKKP